MPHPVHSENVQKLVSKQVTLWNLKRQSDRAWLRNGRGEVGRLAFGPYLLISREKGSGGLKVAEIAGDRLGWPVFDRKIVEEIGRQAHVREQLVESVDERARGILDDLVREMLLQHEMVTDSYFYNLKKVILMLGHQGDVVIVGRGAEFILPGEFGLRVRLVAPLAARIERVRELTGLSLEAAREEVVKTDHERAEFVRRQFGREAGDHLDYDLIINTGAVPLEKAAETVLAALEHKLGVTPEPVRLAAGVR